MPPDKNQQNDKIKKRKLILHFDQHNTIQVACKLPGREITVEEGMNNFLTTVTWGEEINGEWVWRCDEPKLTKPRKYPNAITYFKYLENVLVRVPSNRVQLRKRTCRFVFNEPGSKFRCFFDSYLTTLKYEIRLDESMPKENAHLPVNVIQGGDNGSLYHLIFPQFFDLIRQLQREEREFAIILRTMGIDSHTFIETIKPVIEGHHRDFEDLKPLKINTHVGNIKRNEKNEIEFEIDGVKYKDEMQIYEKLNSIDGICAIRDDFAFWQMNSFNCYSAKPLWINLNDSYHQHILFDDNVRIQSSDDCIVNLRIFNENLHDFFDAHFDLYKYFLNANIIQPNLIKLLNPNADDASKENFYLNEVRYAEQKYDEIMKTFSSKSRRKHFDNSDKDVKVKEDLKLNISDIVNPVANKTSIKILEKSDSTELENGDYLESKLCFLT